MEKKEIIKALDEVADELYSKLGTDSYVMRCTLYDVRKAIESVAKPLKEMIMQMFSDASVMNGASYEERSIPDYNYDSLADAILAFEPTDSVVSQGEKREVFDREQVTKFWLWLTRKANVEVIDAETAIEVHGYANSAGLVPVISFKELLDLYESENGPRPVE